MENSLNNNTYASLRDEHRSRPKQSISDCFASFLARNDVSVSNSSSRRLLLLLFIFHFSFFISAAQPHFNRLYTNSATGSIFQSICPQGNAGGFMAVALVNDSTKAQTGVRVSRIDAEGNVQSSSFIEQSDYPGCTLYPRKGTICKVNENSFAVLGDLNFPDGRGNYAFILLVDSNGILQKFKGYKNPYPSATDSLLLAITIAFDGQSIIVFGDIADFYPATKQLLVKLDTALNVLWEKTYTEGVNVRKLVYSLHADSSGYVLGGYSDNGPEAYGYKSYRAESVVFRTDTSGAWQWTYRSPTMASAAADIVRTADGGYVYSTRGNVIDTWPIKTDSRADWEAQELLVKIDSDGVWQWEKVYDTMYGRFGVTGIRLLAKEDGGFRTLGRWEGNTYAPDDTVFVAMRNYDVEGTLINSRKYTFPADSPMKGVGGAQNDIIYTSDKGIVMAGYFDNRSVTAPAPAQRGWLLKVDSNGCMGAADPQCDPVGIPLLGGVRGGFSIYPNPSSGTFELLYNNPDPTVSHLLVSDLSGRVLYEARIGIGTSTIDARNWAAGIYIYSIRQGDKLIGNGKLVKQ